MSLICVGIWQEKERDIKIKVPWEIDIQKDRVVGKQTDGLTDKQTKGDPLTF